MKVLFLNVWCGKKKEDISEYLKKEVRETDIFCFQEAKKVFKEACVDILSEFADVSAVKISKNEAYDQTTYVRKSFPIVSSETLGVGLHHTGFAVYTEIRIGNQNLHIMNVHGIAHPGDKLDTDGRIEQSETIIQFLGKKTGPKIVGGDFNLLPNTESIGLFKKEGYRNLISDFDIPTTRNELAWERYPQNRQYFADYVFISPEIRIESFAAVQNKVSDHLPLALTFGI